MRLPNSRRSVSSSIEEVRPSLTSISASELTCPISKLCVVVSVVPPGAQRVRERCDVRHSDHPASTSVLGISRCQEDDRFLAGSRTGRTPNCSGRYLQYRQLAASGIPPSLVCPLRDRFEAALVRPAPEDMNSRRLIAGHGYAYCHPDHVEHIRFKGVRALQRRVAAQQHGYHGSLSSDRMWHTLEYWTGYELRDPSLAGFKGK